MRWHLPALALSAVVAIPSIALAAGVYKWTDEAGNIHYGDKPPQHGARQEMQLRKTPAVDPDVNTRKQKTERLLNAFAAERQEKKAARAALAAEKKERESKCARAREIRQKYENSAFIYTKDASGERTILNDEQHARVMADSRAAVDKWCK